MQRVTPLEALLRRDRAVVAAGFLAIVALAWAYMIYIAQDMGSMMVPLNQSWDPGDFIFQFVMWAVMMTAMMVPTAAPMLLLFAAFNRRRREEQRPYVPTAIFVSGYVLVWSGFAALATLGQWGLHSATLLSPMMESTNSVLGGSLLVAAGVFQWSPLKYACLSHCRSPLGFLMTDWRDGARGALSMGIHHGAYCVGCCWVLMALLFVTGVMNLLWVALIAAFVLVEKIASRGPWISRVTGVALIALGGWAFAGGIT